jgi:hypothetical protein
MIERRPVLIDPADYQYATRLLSALILDWDLIPFATQGMLIRNAVLMFDPIPDGAKLSAEMLSFINRYKHCRTDA